MVVYTRKRACDEMNRQKYSSSYKMRDRKPAATPIDAEQRTRKDGDVSTSLVGGTMLQLAIVKHASLLPCVRYFGLNIFITFSS